MKISYFFILLLLAILPQSYLMAEDAHFDTKSLCTVSKTEWFQTLADYQQNKSSEIKQLSQEDRKAHFESAPEMKLLLASMIDFDFPKVAAYKSCAKHFDDFLGRLQLSKWSEAEMRIQQWKDCFQENLSKSPSEVSTIYLCYIKAKI